MLNLMIRKMEKEKCRLHMEFSRDGTALKISTSNGDKAYCEAIKSAAHKAKFPAFNNPEVYRDFQNPALTCAVSSTTYL